MVPSLALRARVRLGLIRTWELPTSWWVLRNKRFRLYFCGSAISDLGTWLQNTAQVMLAYQIAHFGLTVG